VPVPSIERTLVKSPPELWELVDDRELMERWSAELFAEAGRGGVRVLEREPGERLVWEVPADGYRARIELLLAEKGWGTTVSIRIVGPGARSDDGADSPLEHLLDELGSPQRQPFTRT
jgi:uncharacterized protein YndB with AHSA1/START domain